MKGNRSPVMVDVLYSLEWFLLIFAACIPFVFRHADDPVLMCVRLLPAAAVYAVAALVVRLVKIPALRLSLPVVAAAGCIFVGSSVTERVLLGILGIFAVVCAFVIHFGLRRGSSQYNNMLIFIPLLVVYAFILGKFDMTTAVSAVNIILAVYLPIFVAVWYINRLVLSVSIFAARGDQPIGRISKRMYTTIASVVLLILFITLIVPQSDGVSILFSIIEMGAAGIFALVILLIGFLPAPEKNDELAEELGASFQPAFAVEESTWDIYLLYALAAVVLIILVVSAVTALIRIMKYLIKGFMQHDSSAEMAVNNGNDTIEKIDRRTEKRTDDKPGKTNAGKIRRIYKKRVRSVLGDSLGRLSSLTPSEISAMCRKKGEDITELTQLYKKARYTNSCTAEDLQKARRL